MKRGKNKRRHSNQKFLVLTNHCHLRRGKQHMNSKIICCFQILKLKYYPSKEMTSNWIKANQIEGIHKSYHHRMKIKLWLKIKGSNASATMINSKMVN